MISEEEELAILRNATISRTEDAQDKKVDTRQNNILAQNRCTYLHLKPAWFRTYCKCLLHFEPLELSIDAIAIYYKLIWQQKCMAHISVIAVTVSLCGYSRY